MGLDVRCRLKRFAQITVAGFAAILVYCCGFLLYINSRVKPLSEGYFVGDSSFLDALYNDDSDPLDTHRVFRPLEHLRIAYAKNQHLRTQVKELQGIWVSFRQEEPVWRASIIGHRVILETNNEWSSLSGTHTLEWPSMIVVDGEEIGLGRTPAEGIFVSHGERYVQGSSLNGLMISRGSEWSGEVFDSVLIRDTEQTGAADPRPRSSLNLPNQ